MRTCSQKNTGEHSGPTEVSLGTRKSLARCLGHVGVRSGSPSASEAKAAGSEDKHLASRIVAFNEGIIPWLGRRERPKGSRANPNNRKGHRETDTYRTAKHHHEI